MRSRRGSIPFSGKTLLAFALVVGGFAYLYLPMYWDYWAMRTVVKDCVAEWKRTGTLHKDMLYRDMDRKEISTDVEKSSCRFLERKKSLEVECAWMGYNIIPLFDKTIEKEFSFGITAELDGDIEFY